LTGRRRDQLNGSASRNLGFVAAMQKIGSPEPVQALFRYDVAVVQAVGPSMEIIPELP
jgi:hypothetical protein